ncbi:LysR family substrate-binding domain-containing protein [Alcaligenaceae bacterium]|nr:LysR family substrate-binding domain-containing protein [Alcaligenaceae bacterium]
MPSNADRRPLRIAVSFGAIHAQLATLLARQRIEEPETPVALYEVAPVEQIAGLKGRRYELGFTLDAMAEHGLKMQPLWYDELAVMLPVRSPLLVYPVIPVSALVDYPVVMWHSEVCAAMHYYVQALFVKAEMTPHVAAQARSFEFMATVVAAGYGVGLAACSRIDAAREAGIVARPLHADDHTITTFLLYCDGASERGKRFIERARRCADTASLRGVVG